MYSNEDFARYLGVDYQMKGNLCYINCPFHGDSHPSMVIYPEIERAAHCYPCGQTVSWAYLAMEIKGISYREALEDLGQETLSPSEVKAKVKVPSPLSFCDEPSQRYITAYQDRLAKCSDDYPADLTTWLNKKHLLDTAKKLGWKWHSEGVFRHWKAGVVIPYYLNGKPLYVRFRGLQTADMGGHAYFEKPKGPQDVGIQPYLTTFRPNDTVFIVEGESDAASVWAKGYSAIGIPGACSKKAINTSIAFIADHKYVKRVVACGDKDAAGERMNNLIRQAMLDLGLRAELLTYSVESPDEKADLNDDYVAGLFKPPVEWSMNHADNFDRNFPDSDFGEYVNRLVRYEREQAAKGVDIWQNQK